MVDPADRASSPGADPADVVTLDESVSMALLVVLEALSPAERTAFLLHDVFGLGYDEIAGVVGRPVAAVRQLASRARRRVHDGGPRGQGSQWSGSQWPGDQWPGDQWSGDQWSGDRRRAGDPGAAAGAARRVHPGERRGRS
jgi:hypothetical protein